MSTETADPEWSTNRWSITRNGPWHVTVKLRGMTKGRSYGNAEAVELAKHILAAAGRARDGETP